MHAQPLPEIHRLCVDVCHEGTLVMRGTPSARQLICVPSPETALGDAVQRDQAFPTVQVVMSVGAVDRACQEPPRLLRGREETFLYLVQSQVITWPFGLVV